MRHNDINPNDTEQYNTQPNDPQQNDTTSKYDVKLNVTIRVTLLSVILPHCRSAECRGAKK